MPQSSGCSQLPVSTSWLSAYTLCGCGKVTQLPRAFLSCVHGSLHRAHLVGLL